MPEISAERLAILERSATVLERLNADPRSKPLLEKGLKVHFPNITTEEEQTQAALAPHLEAIKSTVEEKLNPVLEAVKTITERDQAASAQAVERELQERFDYYRDHDGLTDDGLARVKQLMLDRSIPDVDAAMALFKQQNPAPSQEAPGWTPQSWNMEQSLAPDVEGLFKNEDAWGDRMAAQTLQEIRLGNAA